ncbi:MAG: aldo/keto reductase [Gemmatimonadota bacterium]|nr:MAG: aldo/keto reductase [Gemmatimonadota bacterium]
MTLPTRTLGSSGFEISVVGFGAWAAGGGGWAFGWGHQDDARSLTAMKHAIDLGINWIDTAPVYGLGHSEEVVGQLLRETPSGDRPLIFTKCGQVWDSADRMKPAQSNLAPASIRAECEASLKRLGIDCVDLLQFHWPDRAGVPVEDSWGEMERLIEEGKTRAGGVSNFDVTLLNRCEAMRHVDTLQPPFSLIQRRAGADVIPWCREHNTGVICYSPMQAGLLTETFTARRMSRLSADDWRHKSPDFKSPNLERNLQLRDALKPIAVRHDTTTAAVAIAWTLTWPGMTAAIVGARSPEQVDGWVQAAEIDLTADDLDDITAAIDTTGAGVGPTRPT